MSGAQIFNAHPRLYCGQTGADADPAILSLQATEDNGVLRGITQIGGRSVETTGLLGVSAVEGEPTARGFPAWITLPSYQDLAAGRRWHFFFAWLFVANGLAYLAYGLLSHHLRRDLLPAKAEFAPSHLRREIADHARLRFPKGEAARHYNALQKITYLIVIFLLLPGMVLTGLSMSPGVNAVAPWLPDLFGGRQSARTVHFLTATALLVFVVVHLAMVLASGFLNNMRSMITGRYTIETTSSATAEPGAKP